MAEGPRARPGSGGESEGERLLDAYEVAILHVPVSWVRAEMRAGRIPHLELGRYKRYSRTAVVAWLETAAGGAVAEVSAAGAGALTRSGPGGRMRRCSGLAELPLFGTLRAPPGAVLARRPRRLSA